MGDKNVEKILAALDDISVQNKIVQIVVQNGIFERNSETSNVNEGMENITEDAHTIENLEKDIQQRNSIIFENEKTINRLEQERDEIINSKNLIRNSLETKQQEVKEIEEKYRLVNRELELYKNQFMIPLQLYQKYISLPEEMLSRLSTVLSAENVLAFIIRGVQWENIEGLEEFIIANLDNRTVSENDIFILKEIFDGLFELFRMEKPSYRRLNTQVGEEFDMDYHTKGAGSRGVSGRIERVLFDGYEKGNRRRKSLVLIED